jgi:tetratricopeptide (TPR) repeat protein
MRRFYGYIATAILVVSLGCSKSTSPEPETTASEYLSQGWTYFNAGSFSAALSSFQQAKSKDANLVDAYNGIGWSYGILGYKTDALANFKDGLQKQTSNLEMRAGIAFVYSAMDSCLEAIQSDSLVISADSLWRFSHKYLLSSDQVMNYKEMNLLLAECYFKLGKFSASLVAVNKLDPLFTVNDINTSEGQAQLLMKIESLGSTI